MSFKTGLKVQKVMVQPIVWLYENVHTRIEGHIIGFDEYMNLVLDEAEEITKKQQNEERRMLGRILLKGENITLLMNTEKPT